MKVRKWNEFKVLTRAWTQTWNVNKEEVERPLFWPLLTPSFVPKRSSPSQYTHNGYLVYIQRSKCRTSNHIITGIIKWFGSVIKIAVKQKLNIQFKLHFWRLFRYHFHRWLDGTIVRGDSVLTLFNKTSVVLRINAIWNDWI